MAIRQLSSFAFDLNCSRFEQPLKIDSEALIAFSYDMSEELLDLEARHLPQNTDAGIDFETLDVSWM